MREILFLRRDWKLRMVSLRGVGKREGRGLLPLLVLLALGCTLGNMLFSTNGDLMLGSSLSIYTLLLTFGN